MKSVFSHPYKTISELHQLVDIDMGMFQSSIDQYIDESCKESHLVFIDGVYTPSLSNLDSIKDSAAVITSMSSLELPLGKSRTPYSPLYTPIYPYIPLYTPIPYLFIPPSPYIPLYTPYIPLYTPYIPLYTPYIPLYTNMFYLL